IKSLDPPAGAGALGAGFYTSPPDPLQGTLVPKAPLRRGLISDHPRVFPGSCPGLSAPRLRAMAIRHWPKMERPREKLLARGAGALSDAELLAVLFGSGLRGGTAVDLARDLLTEFRSLRE